MSTAGPLYPVTVSTGAGTSPEGANDWLTPNNIKADDGSESQITAATFDSPDVSYRIFAFSFGFAVPAGATVNGILVEIDRRSIIASSGKDYRVQLVKQGENGSTGTLEGDNKAATATIWPGTSAVASYGGATDTWNKTGLNPSSGSTGVNNGNFGVVLSAQANIANADIGVDFIRVTVYYTDTTPPTPTLVSESLTKISAQATKDSTVVTWSCNEDFSNYMFRVVPATNSTYTEGSLIEQDQNPASGGTATTEYQSTITDDELSAASPGDGAKIVKLFTKDIAGNWST